MKCKAFCSQKKKKKKKRKKERKKKKRKGLDISSRFSAIFYKGDNFCYCLYFLKGGKTVLTIEDWRPPNR